MRQRQYHFAFGSAIDATAARAGAADGERPRQFVLAIADSLKGQVWEPTPDRTPRRRTISDRIAAIAPHMAAFSETVVDAAADDDVIFCNSEGASIPIAARLLATGKNTKLVALVHNLLRPRMTALQHLTKNLARHDGLYSVSPMMVAALKQRLGGDAPVYFVREQSDDQFFHPGPPGPDKQRPLLIGVGLEQRDYRTLASAAGTLDFDIKISGFSKDTKLNDRALPDPLPDNMEQRFFEWRELAQLYRDSDLVIAPLFENTYAAGISTILEGMASARPVIASQTDGLKNIFADESVIRWVPPGDVDAMRNAINAMLADRDGTRALAEKSAAIFKRGHSFDGQVREMADRLSAL